MTKPRPRAFEGVRAGGAVRGTGRTSLGYRAAHQVAEGGAQMMQQGEPFARDGRPVCGVCPSLRLPGGRFDVAERPSRDCPFDPATGNRYTAAGVPVCVHPERVGLPAAPYATDALPLPWETPPPVEAGEVPAWVRAALDAAPPEVCDDVIGQAVDILLASDPDTDITAVLRAALG